MCFLFLKCSILWKYLNWQNKYFGSMALLEYVFGQYLLLEANSHSSYMLLIKNIT